MRSKLLHGARQRANLRRVSRDVGITVELRAELRESRLPLPAGGLLGGSYQAVAEIVEVGRAVTRNGTLLDSVVVLVTVVDDTTRYGTVRATYLFKRAS